MSDDRRPSGPQTSSAVPGRSVLAGLEARGRPAPRLRLREPGAADAPASGPAPAAGAPRYEVLGEIAAGAVGAIHRARDGDLGREVALKVLHERHLGHSSLVRRFVEEAQVGAQLQHPGIVAVYDLGLREDRRPFFAMRLVKGRTLAAILAARKTASEDAGNLLAVFESACRTVAYAHARGVIHRDLKPSNVMVGAFGEVCVLDWGFAKVLAQGGVADERRAKRERKDLTQIETVRTGTSGSESVAGSLMGTLAYMPPEQAMGLVGDLDERSDVFSLGAVLCEILTGTPPYAGDGPALLEQARKAILDDAFRRLDGCGADPALVSLAKESLAPLRRDRPVDAGAVADRVAAHLASVEERIHASRIAAVEARTRTRKAHREAEDAAKARRLTMLLAGAVLFASVVGAGSWTWSGRQARDRAEKVAGAVEEALNRATLLRGTGDRAGAIAAARQGVDLSKGAPPALRERAAGLLGVLEKEKQASEEEAALRKRDLETVDRLTAVSVRRGLRPDAARDEAAFGEILKGLGMDPDALEPAAMAEKVKASAVAPDLLAALDELLVVRRTGRMRDWERIARVLSIADPDPWREKMRGALGARERDLLVDASVTAGNEIDSRSLRDLVLLVDALGAVGEPFRAWPLLVALQPRHPEHAGLEARLAGASFRQREFTESARFAEAVHALRPADPGTREFLEEALKEQGLAERR